MDATRTSSHGSQQLGRDAEDLVRRLDGVAHVRVLAGTRGIDAIHAVASDAAHARVLAARIRSALLAGLAAPVLPSRIHVRVADDPTGRAGPATAANGQPRPAAGPARPAHRVRLLEAASEPRPGEDPDGEQTVATPEHGPDADATDRARPVDRPRLVSVDVERRTDRRVLCRVAVAHAARVHTAEAVAVDLPGAAAQAAAQATVRALSDAGIPGLELNGLREVEIAGRDFVIVALRRTDTSRRLRSGSAPIIGSAERSAAEATVVAANELI